MTTQQALNIIRTYSAHFADPEDYAHALAVIEAGVDELRWIDGVLGYDEAWAGLGLHDAVAILRDQRDDARNALRDLVAMDDQMQDPTHEDDREATYAGAYYCYYEGQQNRDALAAARKAIGGDTGGGAG
jgi:hypothetical protein